MELGVQDREDVGRERRAPKVGEQTFKNPTLYNRSKFSGNVLKSLLKSKQRGEIVLIIKAASAISLCLGPITCSLG